MSLPSKFDCEQTFRQLNDYLDRELSSVEVQLVEEHLSVCRVCAAEYEFEGALLAELRLKARVCTVPDELKGRIADVLRKARESS